jgi:hypothetical protein
MRRDQRERPTESNAKRRRTTPADADLLPNALPAARPRASAMEARPRCTPPHDRQAEAVPERVLHGRSSFPRMRATVSRTTGTPVRRVLNVRTCLLSLFVGVPRRVPAEAMPTNYVTKEEMRRCIASELQSVGVEAQSSEPTAWNTTQSVESMGTLRSSRPLHRQRHLRAWAGRASSVPSAPPGL